MIQIRNLTISYKKDLRVLLKDFSLTLNDGDRCALIGEEGNGKSTLLKWIADPESISSYCEASGNCTLQGEVGYLPQVCTYTGDVYSFLCEEENFLSAGTELYTVADAVHVPLDLFYSDQTMQTLSGGEKIKIQIARLLFQNPSVLLLDEPSNDLDIDTLTWLESFLLSYSGAVLFISHDETLLRRTANRIVHIELLKRKRESRFTIMNVGYDEYTKRRSEAFRKQNQLAEAEHKADRERMERYRRIQQNVEYDLRNISRQDAHGGQLLKKKMHAVKSMEHRFDRERVNMTEFPEQEEAIVFTYPDDCSIPAGKMIFQYQLDTLWTADQRRKLSENITLSVYGPAKICIIGHNGCGKTTLLRKIAQKLSVRSDIRMFYMPQDYNEILDGNRTPVDYLSTGDRKSAETAREYLGSMRYTTDEMSHAMQDLSGGQRAKVLFLKSSLMHANVLVLDEPTRNFSPLSAPVIRNLLKDYPGCIISVSHDRCYLRDVIDTVYEMDENGLHNCPPERYTIQC